MGYSNDALPLGHLAAGDRLTPALDAAHRAPDAAVEVLSLHRVIGLANTRLADLDSGSALAEALQPALDRRRIKTRLVRTAWEEVGEAVKELGIQAEGIKGHSVVQLYDDPEHRDLGDVDLMVNTADDAWRLAGWFRRRGYNWSEYELPWIKRDRRRGHLYGQAAVWKFEGDIAGRVDIHFGGYSIRHCRLFPYQVEGEGLTRTAPHDNLPMLLGNAAGDFLIRLKDINDIVAMLRAVSPDQWVQALANVTELGLAPFWNALLDAVEATAALTEEEQATAAALRVEGVPRERVPFGSSPWKARCRATVIDAYRAGRAQDGTRLGLAYAWSAYRYYRRRLPITVSDRCRHRRSDTRLLDRLRNDVCVRLVPTALIREKAGATTTNTASSHGEGITGAVPGSTVLRSATVDGHLLMAAGESDIFAPTVYGSMCVTHGSH